MLKCEIKVHKSCTESILFLDDILANNPGTIKPEKKTDKNSKKRLLGLMSRSNSC
jgi:hypothetical protein